MATSTWVLDKIHNRIYNSAGTENVHNAFEPPYPSIYWYVTTSPNNITHGDFKEPQYMGAFMNASNLTNIQFPKSLTYLGTNVATNTSLTNVTIPSTCTYDVDTTFPSDCTVNFFPNE